MSNQNIPSHHLTALVRHFQAGSDKLVVDGLYGKNTAAALEQYLLDCSPGNTRSAIQAAFESALQDVGEKEEPLGSNAGPYVEGLQTEAQLPRRGGGEWCALFCTVHLQRFGIDVSSRGAAELVHMLKRLGREVKSHQLHDGFYGLALRKRIGGNHVQLFRVYDNDGSLWIQYVAGNENHRVKSKYMPLTNFLKGVTLIATTA